MNWKLVLQLSMFGLAMAIGTVFFISSTVEPFCWLAIFLICAYLIATRAPGKPFLHGLTTGVLNSVWMTSAHVVFFQQYAANHAKELEAFGSVPLNPRVMMALIGPAIGVISGVVLGLFAIVATKLVRRGAKPSPATT